MKRQEHWQASLDGMGRTEDGNFGIVQLSSRDQQESNDRSNTRRDEIEVMDERKEEKEQNAEGGRDKERVSVKEVEGKPRQENQISEHLQRGASPIYVRVGPNGEREAINVISVNPLQPNPVTNMFHPQINIVQPNHLPPHFPPTRPNQAQRPAEFKSLENVRNVTQQSFTPSQKTIVLNHISNQINGVYQSHVSTQRMAFQAPRQNNTRSHIGQTRVLSPARVSFDYQTRNNNLFNSHIPTSPVIAELTGAATSSNAPHPSQRHFDHVEQTQFWKEKYEELSRRWESGRAKDAKEQEVAVGKLTALQQNYQLLQTNYDQLLQEYDTKLQENQRYYEQIQTLKASLNQRQPSQKPDEDLLRQLKQKDQQLKRLSQRLQLQDEQAQGQRAMIVGQLRQQNQEYQLQLQELQRKYQQDMREMHEHATMMQLQLQQRDAQLREKSFMKTSAVKKSDNSQLVLDHSKMESFDNTRMVELELHVGKLNSQLHMREESFQRELKMANLNVAELVDRLKTLTSEKDQVIRTLQEKVGLLESDLNKKDSVIRNLRDDATRFPSSPPPPLNPTVSSPAATVYSSAVSPSDHRVSQKEQSYKRQVENMRRTLFQRDRQKMILKQKYEELQERLMESQEALAKRKLETQAFRRQLNDLDNLQHENQKLMEVLSKKNAELLEMKEMLLEKEQYAGDFQNLSMENDRLRNVMVKKNEELSEMAERLYNEEKKVRELENSQTPKIHELEEQLEHFHDVIEHKDGEIARLSEALQAAEGNYSEAEFQLQRHRNIAQEYEAVIRLNMDKIESCEEELNNYRQNHQNYEQHLQQLMQKIEESNTKARKEELQKAKAQQQAEQLARELQMRAIELEERAEMETKLVEFKHKSTKELQAFQSKQGDLQGRCRELQAALRSREQRTLRAQREAEQAREQARKHQYCEKTIEQMTDRIATYEMRIISLMNRGYHLDSEPGQVFENRVIYRLKRQNDALKEELYTLRSDNPTEEERSIKQRLGQFNSNLHHAIEGQGLKRVRSAENLIAGQVSQLQNQEIQRLKRLAKQMQREQRSQAQRKTISPEYIDLVFQQQIAFYRTKNKELEERVGSLLKANRQLKITIEESLLHKNASLKEYYQLELRRLEKQLFDVRTDRSRAAQQLRTYEQRIRALQHQPARIPEHDTEIVYNYRLGG